MADATEIPPLTFTYTNWRGETATRTVRPIGISYASTEWHPEPGWLLHAYDDEKKAGRDFAFSGFAAPQPAASDVPHDVVRALGEVDWNDLNEMFKGIPAGPYQTVNSGSWEVRQVDTDPTNNHHWPFRLCQSIAGQTAACHSDVFSFIAGVLNAWPSIAALATPAPSTSTEEALRAENARLREELACTLDELIDHNGDDMIDSRQKRAVELRATTSPALSR